MDRVTKRVCAGVLSLLLTPVSESRAQSQNKSTSPDSSGTQQTIEPPQTKERIRTHVNEVVVPVTVTDKKGELVLDLSESDFHVFDAGVEQKIDRFDLDGDPLAVALVIESSAHIEAMASVIHSIGNIFTETVMALSGQAAVITYDSTVEVRQPFTQDHDAVEKAISKIEFQTPERKLYDGMAKGVEMLKDQPSTYRRIMLVIGESQDYSSETNLRQVVRSAHLADIVIYAVGPSSTTADLRGGPGGMPPIKIGKDVPPITVAPPPKDLGDTPALTRLLRQFGF
jgi:VWFA-related protein